MKTKRFFFEWIWQWINDDWIGWNPIGIEFEYDKSDPSLTIMVVLLGVGFEVTWLVPWETDCSRYAKECAAAMRKFFGPTLAERDHSGDVNGRA